MLKLKRYFFEQRKRVLEKLSEVYSKQVQPVASGSTVAVGENTTDIVTRDVTDEIFDAFGEERALRETMEPLYWYAIETGAESMAEELGLTGFVFEPLDAEFLAVMELKLQRISMCDSIII